MTDQEYYFFKLIADSCGYIAGIITGFLFGKYFFKKEQISIPFHNSEQKFLYYLSMLAGAMWFGMFISTLDWYLFHGFPDGQIVLSKTVAWAIAGWVIASEIFKKIYKISFNRGVLLVPSLCIGILVGRIGAFCIGLRDNTHGIATSLPWWYDYWDGILRHPTQIYEIIILALIFIIFLFGIKFYKKWFIENGFFVFTLIYFLYRFFVGFLMPYSNFWLGMNTIQIVSIAMIAYSFYKLKKFWNIF